MLRRRARRQGTMSAGSATLETRSIHHEMFELVVSTKTADVLCCSCLCVSDQVARGCDADNASVWTKHHVLCTPHRLIMVCASGQRTVIHTAQSGVFVNNRFGVLWAWTLTSLSGAFWAPPPLALSFAAAAPSVRDCVRLQPSLRVLVLRRACPAQSTSDSWRSSSPPWRLWKTWSRHGIQSLLESPSGLVAPITANERSLPASLSRPRSHSGSPLRKVARNRRGSMLLSQRGPLALLSKDVLLPLPERSASSRHCSDSPAPAPGPKEAVGASSPAPVPSLPTPRDAPRASAAPLPRPRLSDAAEATRRSRDKRRRRTHKHAKRSMWREI